MLQESRALEQGNATGATTAPEHDVCPLTRGKAPRSVRGDMRITFELDSEDLKRFQAAFDRARKLAVDAEEIDILDSAKQALDTLCAASAPAYVRQRLVHVQRLLLMFEDDEWTLPDPERTEALSALAYFGDPDDLVPDHLEVIGLIDDAVMLELIARRLRHVLDAYSAFCAYRATLPEHAAGDAARIDRSRLLAEHRRALVIAMQMRSQRGRSRNADAGAEAAHGIRHRAASVRSH